MFIHRQKGAIIPGRFITKDTNVSRRILRHSLSGANVWDEGSYFTTPDKTWNTPTCHQWRHVRC